MMARRLGQVDEYRHHHHHQGNNNIPHSSSLALLQERFNQLQKTREMRLEKELMMMKLISSAAAVNSTLLYHQYVPPSPLSRPSCYHRHDSDLVMFHQKRPSSQLGFSLIQPQLVNAPDLSEQTKSSSSSWLFGTNLGLTCKFDDSSTSDVDTSLHL